MNSKPTLTGWSVLKQFQRCDLHALGETAASPRTHALEARTKNVDKVVASVCPYCAVGCGQLIYGKDEKIVNIEGDPNSPISGGLSLSERFRHFSACDQPTAGAAGSLSPSSCHLMGEDPA